PCLFVIRGERERHHPGIVDEHVDRTEKLHRLFPRPRGSTPTLRTGPGSRISRDPFTFGRVQEGDNRSCRRNGDLILVALLAHDAERGRLPPHASRSHTWGPDSRNVRLSHLVDISVDSLTCAWVRQTDVGLRQQKPVHRLVREHRGSGTAFVDVGGWPLLAATARRPLRRARSPAGRGGRCPGG